MQRQLSPNFHPQDLEEREQFGEPRGHHGGSKERLYENKMTKMTLESESQKNSRLGVGYDATRENYLREMEIARLNQRKIDDAFSKSNFDSNGSGGKLKPNNLEASGNNKLNLKISPQKLATSALVLSPPPCFSNAQQFKYLRDGEQTTPVNTMNRSPCSPSGSMSRHMSALGGQMSSLGVKDLSAGNSPNRNTTQFITSPSASHRKSFPNEAAMRGGKDFTSVDNELLGANVGYSTSPYELDNTNGNVVEMQYQNIGGCDSAEEEAIMAQQ